MNAAPSAVQGEVTGLPGPREPGRRRRRRTIVTVLVVGVAGTVIAVVLTNPFGDGGAPKSTTNNAPTGLATVTQGKVSARTSVSGTLSYAGRYEAINQAGGIFSKLPRSGKVYKAGQTLYQVNGKPVVFLEGSLPVYRDLKQGAEGPDVKQLNAALVALGYGSYLSSSSTTFSAATKAALKELEDDREMKEDGQLSKGEVVYMPTDEVRVTKVGAKVGTPAQPGSSVVEASSLRRHVTVQLDAAYQSRVKEGDEVTITLPDLKTTKGSVSSVGTVAQSSGSGGGAKITVGIQLEDPKATGNLDRAPVQVSIVTDSADNVLSVPVNALLALLDGGYGVEVVDARGTRRLVAVQLGMFDQEKGTVEISGKSLAAGQRVVVPTS